MRSIPGVLRHAHLHARRKHSIESHVGYVTESMRNAQTPLVRSVVKFLYCTPSWLRGTVVDRPSLADKLSLPHTRLAADG